MLLIASEDEEYTIRLSYVQVISECGKNSFGRDFKEKLKTRLFKFCYKVEQKNGKQLKGQMGSRGHYL